ncbi:Ribosomal lysine N-methyltransferase 2 [Candida viswanathii]|uniref:Ribosomal lysine N-methyltransferase 2 n=1 Tax=Candida viswanathii TaxID=5486 RepID=A0A367YGE4_9ASCO|nr:Ribosomal lysine N-methyltransferase 2 [Candida viswanathii]
MDNFDKKLRSLLDWIKNTQDEKKPSTHSYISPKIDVKDVKLSGRGIYAVDSLRKSELILNIPHSFLLNFNTVMAHIARFNGMQDYLHIYVPFETPEPDQFTKIYSKLTREEILELSSFQLLSIYLTFEKQRGGNSFWKPFLDMLPSMDDFYLMPIHWSDEVCKLAPDSTQKSNLKVRERFETDYRVICNLIQTKTDVDVTTLLPRQDMLLSWLCINSRCLYMSLPTSKSTADNFTMAPYVDFMNHSSDDHCTLKIDGKGFQVLTTSSYNVGDQVFLSYGPHSNDFLLSEYGFIIPENRWNDLDVSKYIIPLLKLQQIEFLKENDYYDNYTMTKEDVSFRTQVALATVQEKDPKTSRKLAALINGINDGEVFRRDSNLLLTAILRKVIHEAETHQYLEYADDPIKQTIGTLYRDRLSIAKSVLSSIQEE